MVLFFILLGIGIFIATQPKVNALKNCNDLGQPHAWIWKKVDNKPEYMICSKCNMLPGGDMEENNGN